MSSSSDLIAKLEGLTRPDRGLDAIVWRSLYPSASANDLARSRGLWPRGASEEERQSRTEAFYRANAPRYTASLDAALALVEEKLPGCRVMTERTFEGAGWAMLQPDPASERPMADGATPALAVLIALLRALDAAKLEGK